MIDFLNHLPFAYSFPHLPFVILPLLLGTNFRTLVISTLFISSSNSGLTFSCLVANSNRVSILVSDLFRLTSLFEGLVLSNLLYQHFLVS